MNKRIVFIGSAPNSGNRGNAALAYSMLYILDFIASKNGFNLDITIYDYSMPRNCGKITVGNRTIEYTQYEGISLFQFCCSIIRSKGRALKKLLFTDYVIHIGGGDSFSDLYGLQRFNSINNWSRLAIFLRKKLILAPQTIGPFYDSKVKKRAHRTIEKSCIVFARDKKSYEYLVRETKQKRNVESIDLAFFLPFQKYEFENGYTHVGLNISALLWNGGYTQNNQFHLAVDYQSLIHSIMNMFISLPNVCIHIISHDLALNKSLGNDYEVGKMVYEEYRKKGNVVLSPFFLDPIEAKNYVAGLSFFMGARMHATIAAFSSGVPVYPMAYSQKFTGLFIDTLNYPCGNMMTQTNEVILREINHAYETKSQLGMIIDEKMDEIIQKKYNTIISEFEKILTQD